MGAGIHGGFGATKGRQTNPRFKRIYYLGTVKVEGIERDVSRRVYQRNDIDFDYIDPNKGISNLQLMQGGFAPIGTDGRPIQLHHILQMENGAVVEIREVTHREFKRTLHGLVTNGDSFRNDPILKRQFNSFRKQYWKWRAEEYSKGLK